MQVIRCGSLHLGGARLAPERPALRAGLPRRPSRGVRCGGANATNAHGGPVGRPPKGDNGDLTLKQARGVAAEVRCFPWDQWTDAAAGTVARLAGVKDRTVRKWRTLPHYERAVAVALAADALAAKAANTSAFKLLPIQNDIATFRRDLAGGIGIKLGKDVRVLWNIPGGPLRRGETRHVRQRIRGK